MKISVIIPVYKNKELFLKNLTRNYKFLQNVEVIIVDDFSEENIKEEVHKLYPSMTVLENSRNRGFGPTVNAGTRAAHGDILVLLNSDVRLRENLEFLKERFAMNQNLCAIAFTQIEKNGSKVGKNALFFRNGFVEHRGVSEVVSGINAWAEGGASAFRAEFFHKLGGFRNIYAPFYWEDIDLSYRAHAAGWDIVFDAHYIVEHHHESTIGAFFSKDFVTSVAYRNQFFFIWTNIVNRKLMLNHIFSLPGHLLRAFFRADSAFIHAFFAALGRLPSVIRTRQNNKKTRKMTDNVIFDRLEVN